MASMYSLTKCECGKEHFRLEYRSKNSKVNKIVPMLKERTDILEEFHLRVKHKKNISVTNFNKLFYDHKLTFYHWVDLFEDYKDFVSKCSTCNQEAAKKDNKKEKKNK